MDLINQYNERLRAKYLAVADTGCRKFDFLGGRRSGKSYLIEQILLGRMLRGEVINVATMTAEQGRLGVYADVCDIIDGSPTMQPWVEILKTPRQINCRANRGRMFFNTYPDPERAKGIACDWLYINEANNFTEKQYTDLSASVRRGTFCDRNPNTECWTERNGFALIHSTWKDNDYLTEEQLAWFAKLKEKAESPNATSADIAFYRMYYLGEYAEIYGDIFTPSNLQVRKIDARRLYNFAIVCDPSNLTGGDYFPSVVCATDGAYMYVVDYYSINSSDNAADAANWEQWCKRWQPVIDKWQEWVRAYGVQTIFCESNGVGMEFLRFAGSAGVRNIKRFANTENKHRRIKDNYDFICNRVVWNDTDAGQEYLRQVYDYTGRDEADRHDDNIDCVSSAFDIYYKNSRLMH